MPLIDCQYRAIRKKISIVFLAISFLCAAPLGAQHPNTRMGFWIGLGVGAGSTRAHCEVCDVNREGSFAAGLRLGFALSSHFLLGFESVGSGIGPSDDSFTARMLTLAWYPKGTGAFFVKSGFGDFAYDEFNDFEEASADGVTGMVGIGYDMRVKRNFSLTPSIMFLTSGRVLTDDFGGLYPERKLSVNLLHLGVGFTWH